MALPVPLSDTSTVKVAQPPFDTRAADVIIRTSDKVDFHIYKAVLILASPFFGDMFSLTQPVATGQHSSTEPIPITENSQTFDCLMRLCYPVDESPFHTLSFLESVLAAAIKYQMRAAVNRCRNVMQGFVRAQTLDVYAVCCRQDLEEDARNAAVAWRSAWAARYNSSKFEYTLTGAAFGRGMETVTAGAYYRLLYYLHNTTNSNVVVRFCDPRSPTSESLGSGLFGRVATPPSQTTKEHHCLHDTTDADTVLLSQDDVEFPVHSTVLRLASAGELLNAGSDCTRVPVGIRDSSPLPVLSIDLHSQVLAEVLRLCYPFGAICDIPFPSLLSAVWAAANQWKITRIISAIKMLRHSNRQPRLPPLLIFSCLSTGMEGGSSGGGDVHRKTRTTIYVYHRDGEHLRLAILPTTPSLP
ncbi:hypothetical protein BC835DRAFT_677785 [Cytidiella melzeri]|nr:hypothetical protein BC835DRAFT_677785 [Cytidiella melzeri]